MYPSHRHPARASRLASLTLLVGLVAACGSSAPPASQPVAVVTTPAPSAVASPVAPSAVPSPSALPSPSATPDPALVPADLTGVLVAPELAHRLPLAVMLDDSRAARPQSGFNAASIVYQATADGYETRYMLIFQEDDTKDIGPVRSARFFLVQWAQEVKAALAHYGGDQRTRTYIKYHPKQFTDVDGMGRGNPAYHRIKARKAPHNAYTSTASLRKRALKLGGPEEMAASLFRRPFRDPVAESARAASQRIRIPYRTNVITYRYDPATNLYLRSVNGKAHIDPADGERVTTTNVVVLFQRFRIDTRIEKGHSRPDIKTKGSGKAIVYNEGHRIKATWRKKSDTAATHLYDANGDEIALVRGKTFFQVVPIGAKVTDGD